MIFSAILGSLKATIFIDQDSRKKNIFFKKIFNQSCLQKMSTNPPKRQDLLMMMKNFKILKIFLSERCFIYGPVCYKAVF